MQNNFLYNFFSNFSWKQNLIFFSVTIISIILLIYYLKVKFLSNESDTYKVKNNFKKTFNYIKKDEILGDYKAVKAVDKIVSSPFLYGNDELVVGSTSLKEKYANLITDDFLVKTKLESIKKMNINRSAYLDVKKIGNKAFKSLFEKVNYNPNKVFYDSLVLLNESGANGVSDTFYLDIYIEMNSNYSIGIVFLPFHKVFYPNQFYMSEEEFIFDREHFIQQLQQLKDEGIFVFQIPEKIYNLEFNDNNWVYKENYSDDKEREILENEEMYMMFLSNYFNVCIKQDHYKEFEEYRMSKRDLKRPSVYV